MGQHREIVREVTLDATGGANDTLRAWDAPTSGPLTRIYISLSTGGQPTVAGDLDYEVFIGGRWAAGGDPFASGSTHEGGVSQIGVITIPGGTEIAEIIWESNSNYPSNRRIGVPASDGSVVQNGIGAFPIVVELTNGKAAALTVYVTFVTESVSDHV